MTADGLQSAAAAPAVRRAWLVTSWVLIVLVGVVTLLVVVVAVALRLDDRQIERHLGTATATVLSISALRTGIEFVDAAGVAIRPSGGVLYPGLLSVGQRFLVEYSTQQPTLVRVGGRDAAVGNAGLGITAVAAWAIGGGGAWWSRRRASRPPRPTARRH